MTLSEKIGQMCMYVGERVQGGAANIDEFTSYELSLSEKAELVRRGGVGAFLKVPGSRAADVLQKFAQESRLKIPLLIATDAIHGHGMDVEAATLFPSPIGIASAFDPELAQRIAACSARELRATGFHWSFSPNVDVVRDPRWGRTGETFGEDPLLVAELGAAMVRGYQGENLDGPASVLACAKHLVAGGSPENGLNGAPAEVSERSLREVYYPPFERAVRMGVYSLMPAHNEVNGIPCHADGPRLTGLLRGEWGFEGLIVSDWNDVAGLHAVHRVADSLKEASRMAVAAGIDMHMHGGGFFEHVTELVQEGALSALRIDEAVLRILRAKFALGLFERRFTDSEQIQETVLSVANRELALEASRKALVLLKNEHGILPIRKPGRLLVTGPNADDQSILGDWARAQPSANIVTIVEGIRRLAPPGFTLETAPIAGITCISDQEIREAVRTARLSDIVILVVGENSLRENPERTSGENIDRASLDLPGRQLELLQALVETEKPVVVILVNGAPICSEWMVEHASAIIEAWEPGMLAGTAIAEVLFGIENPSGKLPISFPRSAGHLKSHYDQRPSARHRGRFKFSAAEPLFSFGHGLSYTNFAYRAVRAKEAVERGEALVVEVDLENTGDRQGEEIVLIYLQDLFASVTRPARELKAFRRVLLEAGEKVTLNFVLEPGALSLLDNALLRTVEPGEFRIIVGEAALTRHFWLK
jgi:beta-glucosidase